jgi:hypothetical protein
MHLQSKSIMKPSWVQGRSTLDNFHGNEFPCIIILIIVINNLLVFNNHPEIVVTTNEAHTK